MSHISFISLNCSNFTCYKASCIVSWRANPVRVKRKLAKLNICIFHRKFNSWHLLNLWRLLSLFFSELTFLCKYKCKSVLPDLLNLSCSFNQSFLCVSSKDCKHMSAAESHRSGICGSDPDVVGSKNPQL